MSNSMQRSSELWIRYMKREILSPASRKQLILFLFKSHSSFLCKPHSPFFMQVTFSFFHASHIIIFHASHILFSYASHILFFMQVTFSFFYASHILLFSCKSHSLFLCKPHSPFFMEATFSFFMQVTFSFFMQVTFLFFFQATFFFFYKQATFSFVPFEPHSPYFYSSHIFYPSIILIFSSEPHSLNFIWATTKYSSFLIGICGLKLYLIYCWILQKPKKTYGRSDFIKRIIRL